MGTDHTYEEKYYGLAISGHDTFYAEDHCLDKKIPRTEDPPGGLYGHNEGRGCCDVYRAL